MENSHGNDARLAAGCHSVLALSYPYSKQEREAILTERFYSGQQDGQVTVRDGIDGAKKRPLEPRFVLLKRGAVGSGQAHIALKLLADALGDEARAIATHEHFSRRVVARFPERWTITRSRVLAYVEMFEFEKRADLAASA